MTRANPGDGGATRLSRIWRGAIGGSLRTCDRLTSSRLRPGLHKTHPGRLASLIKGSRLPRRENTCSNSSRFVTLTLIAGLFRKRPYMVASGYACFTVPGWDDCFHPRLPRPRSAASMAGCRIAPRQQKRSSRSSISLVSPWQTLCPTKGARQTHPTRHLPTFFRGA